MLKFSQANAKTQALYAVPALANFLANGRKVYSFDLPAGKTCPGAHDCKSTAIQISVFPAKFMIKDGPHCQFRCFSASQEVMFPNVFYSRKHNLDCLRRCRTAERMAKAISDSLPKNAGIIRLHVSGDFFSQAYFDAWRIVAVANPDRLFYAYTKSIPFWLNGEIPNNLVLTASLGGNYDSLAKRYRLRTVRVVFSESEAGSLPIDHTDELAANPELRHENFALLLHSQQPRGSQAAEALKLLKKNKVNFSYTRKPENTTK